MIEPNAVDGVLVTAEQIKALSTSSDDFGGIVELIAEDTVLHASGDVTLTVRNLAGNTASTTVDVTVIPYRGLITEDNGYLQNMLHLGANFDSDDLQPTGIDVDQLAAFDGQAHQNPWPGLIYTGLSTQGGEPAGQLTWTPARTTATGGQTWVPIRLPRRHSPSRITPGHHQGSLYARIRRLYGIPDRPDRE